MLFQHHRSRQLTVGRHAVGPLDVDDADIGRFILGSQPNCMDRGAGGRQLLGHIDRGPTDVVPTIAHQNHRGAASTVARLLSLHITAAQRLKHGLKGRRKVGAIPCRDHFQRRRCLVLAATGPHRYCFA